MQTPISDTYPKSGVLEQSRPLGKETVYVVLTQGPVDPESCGVAPGENFVRLDDSLDLAERYVGAVAGIAGSSPVALAKFQYFV